MSCLSGARSVGDKGNSHDRKDSDRAVGEGSHRGGILGKGVCGRRSQTTGR